MNILCIDDDRTFITLYENILAKILMPEDKVYTTINPEEGIELVQQKAIDVVITDLVMPKISGLVVLQKVKEINSAIEIIVVTGQGSIDSAVEAMRLGARDYLTKPLNKGMLKEKIENIREFINRTEEVEEYRFAKETIESNAHTVISDLEIKLSEYISIFDKIKSTLKSNDNGNDKISQIQDIIRSF